MGAALHYGDWSVPIIIIIINNQPTDKVRPVGWNIMKTGLSSSTCPGLYGI